MFIFWNSIDLLVFFNGHEVIVCEAGIEFLNIVYINANAYLLPGRTGEHCLGTFKEGKYFCHTLKLSATTHVTAFSRSPP
jgi:hypothetical protein